MTNDPATTIEPRLTKRRFVAGVGMLGAGALAGPVQALRGRPAAPRTLTVRVENVADDTSTMLTPSGTTGTVPVVLSPGAYAVHRGGEPIFSRGETARGNGLTAVAEAGKPGTLVAHLSEHPLVTDSGAFSTPTGGDGPAPLPPGEAYEFEVRAFPSSRLSLVTMFVQSNDLFYALGGPDGLRLFDGTDPVDGEVTDYVTLWDAGTEVNEEPGAGENQAPRQSGPNVGLVERGTVAPVSSVNGYEYPAVADVLRVTIRPD